MHQNVLITMRYYFATYIRYYVGCYRCMSCCIHLGLNQYFIPFLLFSLHFRFDYALKLSEIEQLKRDHEIDLSLLDSPQSNWKTMLDKERKSRNKMLKTMTTLEKRFAKQKADLERESRRKTEESEKNITELKSQNESLRKKIE